MRELTPNTDRVDADRYRSAAARMKDQTAALAYVLGPDETARLLITCAAGLLIGQHGADEAAAVLAAWSRELLAEEGDGRAH